MGPWDGMQFDLGVLSLQFPNRSGVSYLRLIQVIGLLLRQFIGNEGGRRRLIIPVSRNVFIYRTRIGAKILSQPSREDCLYQRGVGETTTLPALRCSEMEVRKILPTLQHEVLVLCHITCHKTRYQTDSRGPNLVWTHKEGREREREKERGGGSTIVPQPVPREGVWNGRSQGY